MGKEQFDLEALRNLSSVEKEKALEAISLLEGYQRTNPLFYYNHPILSEKPVHWKQLAFHAMYQRFRSFYGGNQSGKTTAGLVDDIIQAVDWEVVPKHLHFVKRYDPPCFIRILTTDMVTMELTLIEKLKEYLPVDQLISGRWDKAYNQQLRTLRFKNGSIMQFMTYKQEVSTMGGATLDRVHYDEEPPKSVWEENNLRVMRKGGDQILTMTPLQGLTWSYQQIWEAVTTKENEVVENAIWENDDYGVVLVDMDDNPYLSEEDKDIALKPYPPEIIDARKRGKYVHFAGLIFGEFDHNIHKISDADIFQINDNDEKVVNPNINVIVGIDPGIRNRCAVVWAALDYNDEMYVFDELYEQGKTIEDICDLIKRTNAMWQIEPIYYVIDPAARNKNNQTGRSDQMEFSDHGIFTLAGQHAVEAGINRVKERLRNHRLFIFDRCRNTIKEFEKYRWKDAPGTGEDGRPQPVKAEDHAMDALRYLIMSRPYLPEEQIERQETDLQRTMREDQERVGSLVAKSEFGGVFS